MSSWVWGRVFFGDVDRESLARFGRGARDELVGRASALYAAHRGKSPDSAGRYHLAVSCWVLGVYEGLSERGVGREESIGLLKVWLTGPYGKLLGPPLRLFFGVVRRPYRLIRRVLRVRALDRVAFGRAFAFSRVEGERSAALVVHRCLYHRFFAECGVPELTQVICHSDHAWIDVLDAERHGMRFERPSTLGYGGGQCIFRFVEKDEASGKEIV